MEAIQGTTGIPFFGNSLELAKNCFEFMKAQPEKYGDISYYYVGSRKVVLVADPASIQEVLKNSPKDYAKGGDQKTFREMLGNGLVTNEGDFWRKQRRLTQPLFHPGKLKQLCESKRQIVEKYLKQWENKDIKTTDLHADMSRLTLNILVDTILGAEMDIPYDTVYKCISILNEATYYRMLSIPFYKQMHIKMNRDFKWALKKMDKIITEMIQKKKNGALDKQDILTNLILAQDADTGERMSDQQLKDEVITFFFAGHDTTSNWLTWFFYNISKPGHEKFDLKVFEEISQWKNKETEYSFENLKQLTYTEMCLKESMRVHPPVWILLRKNLVQYRMLGDLLIS